jgi:hypothetical protein
MKLGKIQHSTIHRKIIILQYIVHRNCVWEFLSIIIDKNSCRSANWQLSNNTSLFDSSDNGNTTIETAVLVTK